MRDCWSNHSRRDRQTEIATPWAPDGAKINYNNYFLIYNIVSNVQSHKKPLSLLCVIENSLVSSIISALFLTMIIKHRMLCTVCVNLALSLSEILIIFCSDNKKNASHVRSCEVWSVLSEVCPKSLECDNFSTKLDHSQTLFVYFRNQSSKGWFNNYFKPTVTDIIKLSFISFKTVNSPLHCYTVMASFEDTPCHPSLWSQSLRPEPQ